MTAAASASAGLSFTELALVASNVERGANVRIGPFSVIGREGSDRVEIGDNSVIGDHVLIEPGVAIGADCLIGDHCRIGRGSVLVAGTRISSGVPLSGDAHRRGAAPSPGAATREDIPISPRALVAGNVTHGDGVAIGPFAIVGWDGEEPVSIGAGTKISPFALIEPGVTIGCDCEIDAFCRVSYGTLVGDRTRILYGAAIFEHVRIGVACIIGGDIADNTVLEDYVTFFGEIAHDYRDPGDLEAWDGPPMPSPIIRTRSVVGQNAVIVGGREIGPASYVAAGEIVKVRVPPDTFLQNGQMKPIASMRGLVKTRRDGLDR